MTKFRDLSIKQQLIIIITMVSGIVLLLACAAFVAYDQMVFRRTKMSDLTVLAESVGNDCRSALIFGAAYKDDAEKSLGALQKMPAVISAALYTTNRQLFAQYPTADAKVSVPSSPQPEGPPRFEQGRLVLFQPVHSSDGEKLGTIFLNYSMAESGSRLRLFLGAVAVIFAGAFVLVLLLSSGFQRLISRPIFELADTARDVAQRKDYSARAARQMGGEIGFLTDQFNGMLARIEERDKEVKQVNQQLRQSEHRAQVATQAKSQFLANMSHELRTPLNAIIGFSEILADKTFGEVNEKQGRYVQNILTSGRHLLQLINDILDLAKIEAGKLVLERASFEVAAALRDIQVIVSTLANKKNITIALEVEPNVPSLFADQPKFKQVMYNLLSNAIKFTPDGGRVTVKASVQESDAGAPRVRGKETEATNAQEAQTFVRLSVSDTGIGIKPEHHERVFKEFEQVDSSYGRQQHGTGLGLALTRKLIEMHGGRIWIESEGIEGKGSTFIFLLPLTGPKPQPAGGPKPAVESQQQATSEPRGAAEQAGPLVLVVEDEQQGGELLQEYLASGGYRVAHAWDGEQAVRMARELRPVAVTLDILLPKKNGWEVLSELKADPATKNIPVVIVSVTSDRQLGFSLGAVEYFVKPVSKDQLLAAIRQASAATGRQVQTVLVVDDEALAIEFLSSSVRAAGYHVLEASGGQQGIDLAVKHAPDLIILDLLMPEVSGFEVVQRLRQDERTKDIPVLIYTAKELTAEDRRQLRDRVQSITSKSGKRELLQELERLAKRKQQSV